MKGFHMTAMTLYLAEARISELKEARGRSGRLHMGMFLAEAAQMLRGAVTPVSGCDAGLGRSLREDLGLR